MSVMLGRGLGRPTMPFVRGEGTRNLLGLDYTSGFTFWREIVENGGKVSIEGLDLRKKKVKLYVRATWCIMN